MRALLKYAFVTVIAAGTMGFGPIVSWTSAELPIPMVNRAVAQQMNYSGNVDSRIYHNSGCRYFSCKKCTARFSSATEARTQGFRACKVCKG